MPGKTDLTCVEVVVPTTHKQPGTWLVDPGVHLYYCLLLFHRKTDITNSTIAVYPINFRKYK